jgi:cellulase/cellobiase CelA1
MEYAQNQAKAMAGQQFIVNGGTGGGGGLAQAVPQTIGSAGAKIDALNERLAGLEGLASEIAAVIGAIRPVLGGPVNRTDNPTPSGAVYRLNQSAECAHQKLNDIEETLKAVHRALG